MKVLLRKQGANLYLRADGRWTSDRDLARDFERGAQAITFAVRHRLPGLETLFDFGDPSLDLVFPIHAPARQSATGLNSFLRA